MFKLIFFLAGLAAALIFSALNLGNTVDISFGFKVIEDVPAFLGFFASFLAGAVFTLPIAFYSKLKSKKPKEKKYKPEPRVEEFNDDYAAVDDETDAKE